MPPNFDHIARPYRFLEYLTFGSLLQQTRTHFLPHLLDCRHALVLGDGDGRFLTRLLAANEDLRAEAVDTSAAMLHLLRRRCANITTVRLRTHHQTALTYIPAPTTDLIVTHFFLDCLTQSELDTFVSRLALHTRPRTLWLISDFRIPAGPLCIPARLFIRVLYLAFRLLTGLRTTHLPDHETPLLNAGFTRTAQHLSLFGLLTTELWIRTQQKMNAP